MCVLKTHCVLTHRQSDEQCCSAVICSCIKSRLNNLSKSNALRSTRHWSPIIESNHWIQRSPLNGVQSCSILVSPSSDPNQIRIVGSTNHRWESESLRLWDCWETIGERTNRPTILIYFIDIFCADIFFFLDILISNRRLSLEVLWKFQKKRNSFWNRKSFNRRPSTVLNAIDLASRLASIGISMFHCA